MDCQSIKINLLPEKPKSKTKTKSFVFAASAAVIIIAMSAAGMFFVYSHIASACHATAYCGDGIVNQTSERCDNGTANGQVCTAAYGQTCQYCSGTCQLQTVKGPFCGDGIKNGTEECDGSDGIGLHQTCSDTCTLINIPYCGDGTCNNDETCSTCSADCGSCGGGGPVCGNGILESGEQCDNGSLNGTPGNDCSSTCALEQGSLTVCKYNDVNKNGSYDSGTDTPLAWNMDITYPNASTTTVQTSSETGCYQLSNLPYGTYQISEETKTGWVQSSPNVNPTAATINASNTNPQIIFLNYESTPGPSYGSIQVCKLIDADGLASTTADQYAATSSIWSFDLISASGTTTQSTTIGNNCVTYYDLPVGNYQAQEEGQIGWQLVDPTSNNVNINLSSGDNKTINFVNSQIVVPTGSIAGYKYNDANDNGVIDEGEPTLGGWTIQLISCPYAPLATSAIQYLPNGNWNTVSTSTEPITGQCSVIATTTTDSTGHYQFIDLPVGDYGVVEIAQSNWTQTYPTNDTFYYFHLNAGDNDTNINFANYQPGGGPQPYCGDGHIDTGEQCDNGRLNGTSGNNCSATCQTIGGGGGGGSITYFNLTNTAVTEKDCNVVVTWLTSSQSTSQVYYDTVPHSTSTMPNKDYVYATIDDVSKVTGHDVTITGLKPNTTYYFRAYSEAASTQYSQEISYATGGAQCGTSTVTVRGAEGKPELAITKMVNTDFANPGQKGIEYLITISNKGNLTAYGVNLKDLLPAGLRYEDVSGNNRSWDLGDMAPDTSKAVTYKVDVNADVQTQVYTNTATVTATNQDKSVQATAKLEVRTISVLAATGFSLTEFMVMISALSTLVGLSIYLRRKSTLNED